MNPLSLIRRRIGAQLALALLLASLAPLVGAGLLVSNLIEDKLHDEVDSTHKTLLNASGSLVDGYLRDSEAKLATIAKLVAEDEFALPVEDPKDDARNRATLAKRLNALLVPGDVFLELSYYSFVVPGYQTNVGDNNWQQRAQVMQEEYGNQRVTKSPRIVPGFNDAPELPMNDPMAELPRRGESYRASAIAFAGPIPFIAMSAPVMRKERVIGVLATSVSLLPVRQLLSSLSAGQSTITLRDAAGATVVSDGPAARHDDVETTVPTPAWTLSIRQPRSAAFATLREARRQAFTWFGAAVLLALLLTAFFTSRVTSPVRALSRAAERMGGGDLSARSAVERGDELGQLARAFDAMAESLEKLDQLKSDFVSHVSHELRTPLTAIKLSVANLQDGVVGPLDAKQLDVLARVRADLDRLIRMVNELLDVARLEAGKVELAREACDLGDVARCAVETLRPLADGKGVTLKAEGAASLSGDRAKLHEVVVNLVDNAVKFSARGGEVSVRVRADGGAAEIEVCDAGPGIAPEKLTRIFDKFAIVPGNGAPKPPGAGLGLSITRKIVELHGGTIRAENRPGGGAKFLVVIPATQPVRPHV